MQKPKNYGLPYMGSKNAIVDKFFPLFPKAKHFYDLFGGGGAVTHYAVLSKKYEQVHYNDISDIGELFSDAVSGRYANETRWISREDFFNLKDKEPYIRAVWSFGNNGNNYMYSREVEPWKRALHYARVFGDLSEFRKFGIETDGSRADIIKNQETYKQKYIAWYVREVLKSDADFEFERLELQTKIKDNSEKLRLYLCDALKDSGLTQSEVNRRLNSQMAGHYFGYSQWEFPTREVYEQMQTFMPSLSQSYDEIYGLQELYESLQSLQSLESLQRLQRLQSLESLQRLQSLESLQRLQSLQTTKLDYKAVKIEPDSVIYCDIPYRGTCEYDGHGGGGFDYEAFYDWADSQKEPIFISEYSLPDNRFECIWEQKKRGLLSATANNLCIERIFKPKRQSTRLHGVQMQLF